jgi:hypothetical protein
MGRLLDEFPAVSLAELDERAALLRRVDNKYRVGIGLVGDSRADEDQPGSELFEPSERR